MIHPFDIFRSEPNGGVRWIEASPTLEHAKERIQELAASSPGEYLIVSQKTGHKLTIIANGASGGGSS